MSIIEQAARRLEELRKSGIEVPERALHLARNGAEEPAALVPASSIAERRVVTPAADRDALTSIAADSGSRSRRVEIDLDRLSEMGYVTPAMQRSRIASEFRVIKRQLLAPLRKPSGQAKHEGLIMVTSSLPDEGKTFVSVNLAMSIAMELDKTVLLVDSDVARPSVLSRLGLPASAGLLDLLAGEVSALADVLLRTNVDKLTLLPAGMPRVQATELLASEDMSRLLDELSSRYPERVLIFDAPPLLPSTESRVLAGHMGQVVLVVEADQTAHRSVTHALATLEACPVVMPLLNKISRSEVGSYYGYYEPAQA